MTNLKRNLKLVVSVLLELWKHMQKRWLPPFENGTLNASFPKALRQWTLKNISSTLWRHSSASELGDSTKESSSKREEDRLPAPRLHFSTKVEVKNALLLAATTIPPPSTTGEIPHIKQLPLISKTTCIPKKNCTLQKKKWEWRRR